MERTQNKKILITGGTRGIGKACVEEFLLNNNEVIYTGTAQKKSGENFMVADFSTLDGINEFCSKVRKLNIDILINNAGINFPKPFLKEDTEDILKSYYVNLLAPVLLVKTVLPSMIKNNWGKIINIGSILGASGKKDRASYSMTKSGLEAFTRSIAIEYSKYGINSLCVAPGYIDTDLTRRNLNESERKLIEGSIPIGRFGTPLELAKIIYSFTHDSFNYLSGNTITIDGGISILI